MAIATSVSHTQRQVRNALQSWRGNLSNEQRPLFGQFVELALARVRGPFLSQHPPARVLELLEAGFLFAFERKDGEILTCVRAGESTATTLSCMTDQPFIVDSIRLFLRTLHAEGVTGFNVVLPVQRDASGRLTGLGEDGGASESWVLFESDLGGLAADPSASAARLKSNLGFAVAMVRDFKAMTRTVERFVEKLDVEADRRPDMSESVRETADFLRWLLRENFVFMGADGGQPLGIQAEAGTSAAHSDGTWPDPHEPGMVRVRKSRQESPVHRAGRIDEILVTSAGGESLFLRGMFTYRAVTQPSRNVPILRRVLSGILSEESSQPGSFRYKGLANVFDSLPTEFLLTATRPAIREMVDLVFDSEQQQEVGVTVLNTGEDSAFCLVAMPKGQFGDDLRRSLEAEVSSAMRATYVDHGVFVGRYDTVLLHYYLTGVKSLSDKNKDALADRVRKLATPWASRLWDAVNARAGEAEADRITDTYGAAFPVDWVRQTPPERAVQDIALLQCLDSARKVATDCFRDHKGDLILRLYENTDVLLSDILPVLGHFGLRVIDSYATEVTTRHGTQFMDTFRLEGALGMDASEVLTRAPLLIEAIEAVFAGKTDDDRLNRLVLNSGLTWEEVDALRGYTRYARQLQMRVSMPRVEEILLQNPIMSHSLITYFHARFTPGLENRDAALASAEALVKDELRQINSHDEDLTFSYLYRLMRCTLRTNYYRTDRAFHYISFKFDGHKLKVGEAPPMFEIYVHHKEVEGVHLRFGMVARGGIRWSDRADYRIEVLGLVTTQQVKNVVIVPTGSKGGFFLKNPSQDGRVRRQEADYHYQTFMRGLLDLTDNTVNGEKVRPPNVVCHDGFDPYLVVAADKGTAHLSDTANRLSLAYGHWLGDAFASGGSVGYDHKEVGITARGAWVLVKRHFAEMGRDPYNEPFTCVGIGDMGGDVFGNGLVESDKTQLLAAFNHLHIFLDPTPDVASSYVERKRLFDEVKGWDQYNTSLISAGGGVFDRRAKSVPLSPQVQEMIGLRQDEAEPELVIRHLLKLECDLLWNGGIGTYVKASYETNADADDRSNDALRVSANELRCKVVGEGGNLGFTQRARIEAARNGVRLNTDAIDNSGGVDLSDHEVNLKILLGPVVERGEFTAETRAAFIEELTGEVAGLVLANNDTHGRQLSRDVVRSKEDIFQFGRAISFVERQFGRSREGLVLPSNDELVRRAARGEGLTRPELAVLSAWVKMYVSRELQKGGPRKLPNFNELLVTYFPKLVQERFPKDVQAHMLATEIATMQATTRLVADAGAAFVPLAVETTGATVLEIAAAYFKAQRLAGTDRVRATLEELRTTVALPYLNRAWVAVDGGARDVVRYWLSSKGRIPTDVELEEMRAAVDQVYGLQATEVSQRNRDTLQAWMGYDIPEQVASLVLKAQYLNVALMIWSESKKNDVPFEQMVVRHLAIARASGLQRVLDDLASRPAEGRWDPIALRILHNRFHELLRMLVMRTAAPSHVGSVDALEPLLAAGALKAVRSQVDELLEGEGAPAVSTLLVLEERVETAVGRMGA